MRRTKLIAALTLGLSTLAAPVAAAEEPPPCSFGDEVIEYNGTGWASVVLDTRLSLTRAYSPNDLVSVRQAGLAGRGSVRRFLLADLAQLAADARAAGVRLAIKSAYRGYRTQASTFRSWVLTIGLDRALKTSARAGHSEHQLGTAIDFKSPGGPAPWYNYPRWELTPASRWLAANAWRFGFVLSYPKGVYPATCYAYEPWHYRYVGHEMAQAIQGSGQPPRVWLLTHPTPSPSPQPTPTAQPTSTAEPSPTAGPTAQPTALPTLLPTLLPTAEPTAGT